MLRIAIVTGSTRPGRNNEAVANWVYRIAKERFRHRKPNPSRGARYKQTAVYLLPFRFCPKVGC
jgi:hypothetical protein